eukprot:6297587-Lingulodinium_polyedra.AAC.1
MSPWRRAVRGWPGFRHSVGEKARAASRGGPRRGHLGLRAAIQFVETKERADFQTRPISMAR